MASGVAANLAVRAFEELTPASAWVLGLVFSDGHVQIIEKRQYGLFLSGTEQVVRAALGVLGSGASVKLRGSFATTAVWSKRLVGSLAVHGLVGGNKTLTLRMPELPKDLVPHFVRGLWDGDGSWRRRGNCLDASYCSASTGLIEDLRAIVGGRVDSWTSDTVKVGAVGYHLVLRAEETRLFKEWIYEGSTPDTRCAVKYARSRGEG